MSTRQRGFTFIEILVVMGIIAVLVGISMAAVNYFVNVRAPQAKANERVKRVSGLIGQWKLHFEALPPSDPDRIHKVAGGKRLPPKPDDFNVGIESLYQALYWPGANVDANFNDEEIGNTDQDEYDKPTHQGTTPWEIVDSWGNPLVYFINTEYVSAYDNPHLYINGAGDEVEARPYKQGDESRGFVNPRGYQLFSMGDDGIPNTEDDITSWE